MAPAWNCKFRHSGVSTGLLTHHNFEYTLKLYPTIQGYSLHISKYTGIFILLLAETFGKRNDLTPPPLNSNECRRTNLTFSNIQTCTYDGIRQGPEPGIGTGGYELGTGAVE